MIEIKNLKKKFQEIILDDLTVHFPKKRVAVIVGGNRRGKI